MFSSLFHLLGFQAFLANAAAAPQAQIGKTTLVGLDITGFKLDFFGGKDYLYSPIFPMLDCLQCSSYRDSLRQTSHR